MLRQVELIRLSFAMLRSSKRKIAGQAAAAYARNSKKRQRTSTAAENLHSDSEANALSIRNTEGIIIGSEPEDDVIVFRQPDISGRKDAERQLKGYSKTNTGKTTQSRWCYSQKQ
jgi:hypothetical protein